MKSHKRFGKEYKTKISFHPNSIRIELCGDGCGIEKLCILRVDNFKSIFG